MCGFFARYFSQRDCDNDEANHLWLLLLMLLLLLHRHSPNASKKWEMCEQEGKEIMTVIAKKVPGANLTSFMWACSLRQRVRVSFSLTLNCKKKERRIWTTFCQRTECLGD